MKTVGYWRKNALIVPLGCEGDDLVWMEKWAGLTDGTAGLLQSFSLRVFGFSTVEILTKLEHSIFGKSEGFGFFKHKLTYGFIWKFYIPASPLYWYAGD